MELHAPLVTHAAYLAFMPGGGQERFVHGHAAACHWAGWRLPTEAKWEMLSPRLAWGRRWEWTASAYRPYPGFRPPERSQYTGIPPARDLA